MKTHDDRTTLTKIIAILALMGIGFVALALLLQSCLAEAQTSVTNDIAPPTVFTLTISAGTNGSVRVITSDGSPLVVTQIVRTASAISIALDRGLVFRRLSGDLWQVTTEEKAARTITTGGNP